MSAAEIVLGPVYVSTISRRSHFASPAVSCVCQIGEKDRVTYEVVIERDFSRGYGFANVSRLTFMIQNEQDIPSELLKHGKYELILRLVEGDRHDKR